MSSTVVDVRPVTPADRAAVGPLIRAAFGAEGARVAQLWDDVLDRALVAAELVATEPGTDDVVGHVGISHAWLDARSERVDVLVLSPLSVAPARQRRGVGAALLAAAVAEADRLGSPYLVLEGDPGYYTRQGFVPASAYGVEAPSPRIPGPAFQLVTLSAHEAWMTGRVVYREVWWEHDCVGLRDPELAQVEMSLPD